MKMENLKDLYKEELKDLLNCEQQILKALPKLIKAAKSDDLREALQNHLTETEEHRTRLEQCRAEVGLPAKGKTCDGVKGIITEGDDAVSEAEDDVTDATIIAAAQKVEHYEMASYGCVRTWAQTLGLEESAELLQQTLDEERAADEKLTELAESFANEFAAQGEGDEDPRHEELYRVPPPRPRESLIHARKSDSAVRGGATIAQGWGVIPAPYCFPDPDSSEPCL